MITKTLGKLNIKIEGNKLLQVTTYERKYNDIVKFS